MTPDHITADNTGIVRKTLSVCPVCLKGIPAFLERDGDGVWMSKTCPEHGSYRTIVWRDQVDFGEWIAGEEPETRCCGAPDQGSCCVLLEVTDRCDLRCTYCFAHGGEKDGQPSFEELCRRIDTIADKGDGPLLQLTGGEPTLRDDLPELAAYAKKAGCSYTQVNTNGIRLAQDEDYVRRLSVAGVDIIFLQFDGTDEEIYRKLRGRDLLDIKLRAIENCSRYRMGVTLVPTIVRGVNGHDLGGIIRTAVDLFPAVKSVHFQPVTYLGRHPETADVSSFSADRYTLDELMKDLSEQTGIPMDAWLPSRCDHALCEFHSTFTLNDRRQLVPMTGRSRDSRAERTTAGENRDYVAEHWSRSQEPEDFMPDLPAAGETLAAVQDEIPEIDELLYRMKYRRMKISAMAFQDEMNIDLERVSRCSLHVYDDGELVSFCTKYSGIDTKGILYEYGTNNRSAQAGSDLCSGITDACCCGNGN